MTRFTQDYIDDILVRMAYNNSAIEGNTISLLDRLQHDKGQFKQSQNAIVRSEFRTATLEETPQLMSQWVDNTIYRTEQDNAPLVDMF